MKNTLNVLQFMKLSDTEKVGYIQKTYPCGREDKTEVIDFDFGVFKNRECEDCGKKTAVAYGTSDEREPKWCPTCFVKISDNTDFVKVREMRKLTKKEVSIIARKKKQITWLEKFVDEWDKNPQKEAELCDKLNAYIEKNGLSKASADEIISEIEDSIDCIERGQY